MAKKDANPNGTLETFIEICVAHTYVSTPGYIRDNTKTDHCISIGSTLHGYARLIASMPRL